MGIAAITGSGSGIGAAVKTRFEADGFETIGIDIKNAEVTADLSTEEGRAAAVSEVLARSGGALDRLILCAGLGPQTRPASLVVKVNYFGVVAVLDPLLAALSNGSDPVATVICSNSAQLGDFEKHPFVLHMLEGDEPGACAFVDEDQNGALAYTGSKNAVGRAVRRRAVEWGKAGVRLNAVAPGPVETPLFQASLEDPITGPAIEKLQLPIGRRGKPEDVADLIAFMSGPQASWIHGSIFYIDGGMDALIRPDRY